MRTRVLLCIRPLLRHRDTSFFFNNLKQIIGITALLGNAFCFRPYTYTWRVGQCEIPKGQHYLLVYEKQLFYISRIISLFTNLVTNYCILFTMRTPRT